MNRWSRAALAAGAGLSCLAGAWAAPKTSNDAIGGVVIGPGGPEAGVWVIAETGDLPTGFAKVVVTDDKGRFVIPELPKANYKVWVRGYGLQDTEKKEAKRGETIRFSAKNESSPAAAARIYPGMYWYSLIDIPKSEEFPGTGTPANLMPPTMKSQSQWIDTTKNMCQSCHALGSKGIREIPSTFLKNGASSELAWALRTQAGQAMAYMALALGSMGPEKAYKVFANWTDRIAAGELPFAKPARPQGIERNVVFTMWDWASPKNYQHDAVSSDKRNPRVNANGLIYGSPEESTDLVPTLDPVRHVASTIKHPYIDPKTPSSTELPRGPSHYWGTDAIWDGHTSIHNVMMDEQGKVWFTARLRPNANPDFCKKGSDHPSAKIFPVNESPRGLSRYDPSTGKWDLIDTCFPTHHLYFDDDENQTLWTSAGGPGLGGGVVGWLNTRLFRQTGDSQKSQGWTPLVLDTNGNGVRDEYVEPNAPLDRAKDKRIMASLYAVMPSPVDDTIWGQSMDRGFSRIDQPGYLVRIKPGTDPARTAITEIFQPPEGTFGPRGLDIGLDGVVWTALSSGHLASFDRRLCKGPLNGPLSAEGKHCPEGWKVHRMPGPQFRGVDPNGSAEHAYYVWVDRYNTLGLGANVPLASANGGEGVLALVKGQFVMLRVPHPLGFFTKNFDGRIDDDKKGWKGRGVWTTTGTRANFHGEPEVGVNAYPKVYKVQMRPSPLAY